jgi:SOS response regulatory protein OraA/RecX
VVKNKVSPPFKQAEFDILYGKGISKEGSLIDMGVDQGFIRKSGSWFTYEGEQLGQGKENARNFLLENADVANEIEKKIKEKLGIGAVMTDEAPGEPPGARRLLRPSRRVGRSGQARRAGAGAMPAPAHRAGPDPLGVADSAGQAGLPGDVSTQVLDRLTQVGLLDDADFAEQWVRSRRVNAGKGKRALAVELATRASTTRHRPGAGRIRRRGRAATGRGTRPGKLRRERLDDGDDQKVSADWSACWPAAATARAWHSRWSARARRRA